VVSDKWSGDRLTLYVEAGAVAAVVLDPVCAIALAGKLIEGDGTETRMMGELQPFGRPAKSLRSCAGRRYSDGSGAGP